MRGDRNPKWCGTAMKSSKPRFFSRKFHSSVTQSAHAPIQIGVPVVAVVFFWEQKCAVSYQMTSVADRIAENMRNEINKQFDVSRKFKNKYLRSVGGVRRA